MILLAATLAGSAWLYLYRVRSVARFIDARGYVYHAPYTMSVQPWWSPFAAVLLLAVGDGSCDLGNAGSLASPESPDAPAVSECHRWRPSRARTRV